jgi:hypothetical protein
LEIKTSVQEIFGPQQPSTYFTEAEEGQIVRKIHATISTSSFLNCAKDLVFKISADFILEVGQVFIP